MSLMKGENQKQIRIRRWFISYFLILIVTSLISGVFRIYSTSEIKGAKKKNTPAADPSISSILKPNQPIPFSHRKHSDVGLACLDCHEMLGSGESAGFPSVDFCLACHQENNKKQSVLLMKLNTYKKRDKIIPWVRVYKVPEFIFMSHKKHLDAGATCKICHGSVAQRDILKKEVPTSMKFCMACHQSHGASNECNLCHELNQ